MTDTIEPAQFPENEQPSPEPQATLRGNGYDLTALGALASGVLLLFLCLTCNMGFYCLPLLPLVLGIVGVATARRAVNRRQSEAMAWVGLASGALAILLMVAFFVLYIGMVLFVILAQGNY